MSKMTVIQLLNKIANGEIEENKEYLFYGSDYCTIREFFNRYIVDKENLNLKVETLGEDKKIEKLELVHIGSAYAYALLNEYGTKCALTKHSKVMCDKINEIIDKLNEMEKE